MAAFNFPNPADTQTVTNPITGSTYQWKEPPGKWVITTKVRAVQDIIYEGDLPPDPRGDYKLWYSTDTLELYFWYEDENSVGAWVPTSAPITMLEDLDTAVAELRTDIYKVNIATAENENRIGRTIEYSDTAPTIYPEEEYDGEFFFNELNYKFWYDTSRLELLVLYKDPDDGAYSYVPVSLPLTNLDLDALNTQVQANSYSNNQQEQAIQVLETLIFDRVAKSGDTMTGDLKFEGTNQVVTRNIDSGQNSNLNLKHNGTTRIFVGGSSVSINNSLIVKNASAEAEDLIFKVEGNQADDGNGDNILYVQRKASGGDQLRYYGPVSFNKEVTTKEYVDNITSPFETAIKTAGFQLGSFKYRRGSDDFPNGAIQSNTTTNPENIFELKIRNENADGIRFGNEFYEKFITEKMYVHIRDKSACSYVGRIDEIEMINNGIKLTLQPIPGEVNGTIYYNNRYDVSIGYNKYGVKHPQ